MAANPRMVNAMIHITEEQSAAIASHELAFDAVRAALIAAATPEAVSFPVVLGHGSDPENRFTVKSSADGKLAGLKVGTYFPSNDAQGLPRHSSTILLFDQARGRIGAVVEGSRLNAYRTAAADAVATDALARPDATVLAIFGTGHQAAYEVAAVARVRPLTRILVVGRNPEKVVTFVHELSTKGLPAKSADAGFACRQADIIVTATTAQAPLFTAEGVRPGTHISTMGSDATGKQELPPELLSHATLFADLPEQSLRIGEFQHAARDAEVSAMGAVLSGRAAGRRDEEEITIFDSSGLSIQDLYIARAVLEALGSSGGIGGPIHEMAEL